MRPLRRMRLAVILVATGCAGSLPKQPKPDGGAAPVALAHKTFGVPGETMEYQVDLRGLTVGRVMVAVGQPGWVGARPAIIVRSRGTSAGLLSTITDLRWELTTTLDLETGEVLHETGESWVTFNGKKDHDRFDRDGSSDLNVHAAVGVLRAWRSHVGERAKTDVTIESSTFGVEIWDESREFLGVRPAVRYHGLAHDKFAFDVWIADDASRVPLRVRTETKWGTVEIELVHYDVPDEP